MRRLGWLGLWLLVACSSPRAPLPAPRTPLSAMPAPTSAGPTVTRTELPPLPRIQAHVLANGLKVYVLERHAFPHVGVAYVSMRGGENASDLEAAGLSSVILQLLIDEANAAGKLPAGVDLAGEALREVSWLGGVVERADVEGAIASLAAAVTAPTLTPERLTYAQRSARAAWLGARFGTRGVARNHLMQRIYGPAHVLGQHAEMAVKRVDAHPLDEVRRGYLARYVPEASALVLVGDVTLDESVALAGAHFGAFTAKSEPPPSYAPSDWMPQGLRTVFLPNDARHALVALAQRVPSANHPDYGAVELLCHVLGGSLGSRLMATLRHQRGLTYDARAWLEPRRDGSTLFLESSVRNEAAKLALTLMEDEMKRLQAEPVSQAELTGAREALLHAELARYQTTEQALEEVIRTLSLGREPSTDLAARKAQLDALDPGALQRAAQRVFTPSQAPRTVIADFNDRTIRLWRRGDDDRF